MKIRELNPTTKEFKPFDLVFTIESKRDLEMLWCMFNASQGELIKFLNNIIDGEKINEFLGSDINHTTKTDIWRFLNDKLFPTTTE